jgi:hypothetical protein
VHQAHGSKDVLESRNQMYETRACRAVSPQPSHRCEESSGLNAAFLHQGGSGPLAKKRGRFRSRLVSIERLPFLPLKESRSRLRTHHGQITAGAVTSRTT